METHVAQDVKMVLMNIGGYELTEGGECAFVVGQKGVLQEPGIIDSGNNPGGWNGCERRTWCNGTYKNAMPTGLSHIFRQFKTKAAATTGISAPTVIDDDWFALPAEKEIMGASQAASAVAEADLQALEYYKTAANRKKGYVYWTRSQYTGISYSFVVITATGAVDTYYNVKDEYSLSPFGVIGKRVI